MNSQYYLSATQVKQKVFEATGIEIIVSKAVRGIELKENDILYKLTPDGYFVGIYSKNVVNRIIKYLNGFGKIRSKLEMQEMRNETSK